MRCLGPRASQRSGAPAAIQSMMICTVASGRRPAGGMMTPSGWVPSMVCTRRLLSGSPGMIVGPPSPVVERLLGNWFPSTRPSSHDTRCRLAWKIGSTSPTKVGDPALDPDESQRADMCNQLLDLLRGQDLTPGDHRRCLMTEIDGVEDGPVAVGRLPCPVAEGRPYSAFATLTMTLRTKLRVDLPPAGSGLRHCRRPPEADPQAGSLPRLS